MSFTSHAIPSLAAISRYWLDPENAGRQAAIQALQVSTGYSKPVVERAIAAAFNELTEDKLKAYVAVVTGKHARTLTVLHIAAGNVFTAWLHGAVISLLLGHRVWIKPSAQEPVFANLWRKSMTQVSPEWASAIEIVSWSDTLPKQVDVVIAYGSDETIRALKEKFAALPFVGFGHKISVAIIFQDALQQVSATLEAAVSDIDAFNLAGCLSPQIIFVQGHAAQLETEIKKRLPHNRLPVWKMFQTLDEVWVDCAQWEKQLSCVGIAGSLSDRAQVEEAFKARMDVRMCALGEMQQPPLNWRNGGINLGEFLLKCESRGISDP